MKKMKLKIALALTVPTLGLGLAAPLPLRVTSPPTLTMNPNGVTPLAGLVTLATDVPTRATLRIAGGGDVWAVTFPEARTDHSLPVLALKPGRTYAVQVTVIDAAGRSLILAPLVAVTSPLPPEFPEVRVLTSDPQRMEPGWTLVDRFSRLDAPSHGPTYTMILDTAGEVVWYGKLGAIATSRLTNGDLLYESGDAAAEVDLLGNPVRVVPLADPGRGLHHELVLTEEGHYLSLTRTLRFVSDYPASDTDPTAPTRATLIADNPAVEFAADGSLLHVWPLADLLDPTRIGYGSLDESGLATKDWAHANAVVLDPRDDSLLVSIRHQDAVVKFSRATGELKWILGPPANWKPAFQPFLLQPVGQPFAWPYHPHSPEYTPSGTLLVHDNGNYRASPFDGNRPLPDAENNTRVVEYAVDETVLEARQVWEYAPPYAERIYAPARGDVDWLPGTNVLITYGSVSFTGGVAGKDLGLGLRHGRITEVTHTIPGERVFDVLVFDPRPRSSPADPVHGLELYRSERIPSLYPPGVSIVAAPRLAVTSVSRLRRGKRRSYSVAAASSSAMTECFDYWTNVTLPDGRPFPSAGRPVAPRQVCLGPFSTASTTIGHLVPLDTPSGKYRYHVFAGVYPTVLSETYFDFEVLP
jgi:arylsulfate sulfotransferase